MFLCYECDRTTLELEIGVAMIGSRWVDAVLVGNDLLWHTFRKP